MLRWWRVRRIIVLYSNNMSYFRVKVKVKLKVKVKVLSFESGITNRSFSPDFTIYNHGIKQCDDSGMPNCSQSTYNLTQYS